MTTRVSCADEALAAEFASSIDEAGFDVAVIAEGSDGAEVYVVYTPASPGVIAEWLPPGATVELY